MNVICVHGYLAPKQIFWPIARELKVHGFRPQIHAYASHRGTLNDHGDALAGLLEKTADRPTSIVAHSLGGIVVKNTLTRFNFPIEHLVFIATPHQGSAMSRLLRASVIGRFMSLAVKHTAHAQYPKFSHPSVGIIAGRRDPLVKLSETRLECARHRLELPFGHNEILLRRRTAKAIATFLRRGYFAADDAIDLTQLLP
ncbi:MAG: alpha/beta hydrolase [Myxococcota bacterium]|nr:alpha/beta hydrolase [Myxococcota bacterium]